MYYVEHLSVMCTLIACTFVKAYVCFSLFGRTPQQLQLIAALYDW